MKIKLFKSLKSALSLLLIMLCSFSLFACDDGPLPEESKTVFEPADEQLADFLTYYEKNPPKNYHDIAALVSPKKGIKLKKFDFSKINAPENPDNAQKADFVASCGLLIRHDGAKLLPAGREEKARAFAKELAKLKAEDLKKENTCTVADIGTALLCISEDFDAKMYVSELSARQVRGGGISEFSFKNGEVTSPDPDSSAAALLFFSIYKDKTDSTIYDNTVMYIYNCADTEDASFKDKSGKKNSATTAKTLTALLCAGVEFNGSLCGHMKNAINEFRFSPAGNFDGFREIAGGPKSERATSLAFEAFACSVSGPCYTKMR